MKNDPLIGFGQVRHTRVRPMHNAFAYPTYFLLLPMRTLGRRTGNENGPLAINRTAALSFFDSDHGDGRPPEQGGALGWLDEMLSGQGIVDATGEIWLHCYPRVLGYTFKPVSFWYCHRSANDQGGSLRAIVVEVNNTFGERHCYLLDEPQWGVEMSTSKVFHVSPFCQVEGSYRFRFMRAMRAGQERTVARIDHDDAAGPLLQTSVSGTLEVITRASLRKALWRFPALTLGVVFHIHLQAARLWLKNVKFFKKPRAPDVFVSR
jgi:DUF1365 family protein